MAAQGHQVDEALPSRGRQGQARPEPAESQALENLPRADARRHLRTAPLKEETEITGPMAAKLFISSSTRDADLFLTVQAFSPRGREVYFQGTVDPKTPLAQGWLRASHRKLDEELSEPWRPYHTHDDKQLLTPERIYELDIEIWPQCIVLPKGFQLSINIAGQDFDRPGPAVEAYVPLARFGTVLTRSSRRPLERSLRRAHHPAQRPEPPIAPARADHPQKTARRSGEVRRASGSGSA